MVEILNFFIRLFEILLAGGACIVLLFCIGAFIAGIVNPIRKGGEK